MRQTTAPSGANRLPETRRPPGGGGLLLNRRTSAWSALHILQVYTNNSFRLVCPIACSVLLATEMEGVVQEKAGTG